MRGLTIGCNRRVDPVALRLSIEWLPVTYDGLGALRLIRHLQHQQGTIIAPQHQRIGAEVGGKTEAKGKQTQKKK